jgi:hypothetical protein
MSDFVRESFIEISEVLHSDNEVGARVVENVFAQPDQITSTRLSFLLSSNNEEHQGQHDGQKRGDLSGEMGVHDL